MSTNPEPEKITALCFIRLERTKQDMVLEQVRQLPHVKHYSVITGEFDGIIELEVNNTNQLYDSFKQIDKIPGIKSTNTHIIMKRFTFT